jgi:magnesium transporter
MELLRQQAPDRETIYYCYVVDHKRRLVGFVSLKRLILSRRSAVIEEIMQRDVISARVDFDQEAVARQIDKYDLLAIPIVDGTDMLVGIITHDDAMDILRQEQTEDILAFGGVSRDTVANEETYWQGRIVEAVRRRIGWLLFLFLAGTLTKYASQFFQDVQLTHRDLIDFIPLMIGTGGNAGSQTVGTIIRGLALGEIQRFQAFRVLFREWLTGALLGAALGAVGFLYTWLLHGNPAFAAVIGLAILFICMWANCVGAVVPMLAKRLGIDPAVVSAPLISTLVDATGLVIFYTIAMVVLIKLGGAGTP